MLIPLLALLVTMRLKAWLQRCRSPNEPHARRSGDRPNAPCSTAAARPGPIHTLPGTCPQEPRFRATGKTDEGRFPHITFTLRAVGTLIRVISARDLHRKAKTLYDQAIQNAASIKDRG